MDANNWILHELSAIALPFIDEVTPKSVKLTFHIPKSFVGLPGGIYLRYTQDTRYDCFDKTRLLVYQHEWLKLSTTKMLPQWKLLQNTPQSIRLAEWNHSWRWYDIDQLWMALCQKKPLARNELFHASCFEQSLG